MLRKTLIAAAFVVLCALLLAVVSVAAEEELAGVTIINQSDQTVSLLLSGDKVYYALNVPAGTTRYFTVERQVYDQTTYACGLSSSGALDLNTFTRLVFTPCYKDAVNAGEPSQEKIHIDDSPGGINWFYQY